MPHVARTRNAMARPAAYIWVERKNNGMPIATETTPEARLGHLFCRVLANQRHEELWHVVGRGKSTVGHIQISHLVRIARGISFDILNHVQIACNTAQDRDGHLTVGDQFGLQTITFEQFGTVRRRCAG